jgi:hypothetical protein
LDRTQIAHLERQAFYHSPLSPLLLHTEACSKIGQLCHQQYFYQEDFIKSRLRSQYQVCNPDQYMETLLSQSDHPAKICRSSREVGHPCYDYSLWCKLSLNISTWCRRTDFAAVRPNILARKILILTILLSAWTRMKNTSQPNVSMPSCFQVLKQVGQEERRGIMSRKRTVCCLL